MMRRPADRGILVSLLLLPGIVFLAACSDDSAGPAEPEEPGSGVTTVEVTPSSAELQAVGATRDFEATAEDRDGDPVSDVSIDWSISPDTVGSVDGDGTVTAEANGTATVEAEVSGVTGSAELTVDQKAVALEVSPDTARLELVGETQQLTAEATDANGHPVTDLSVDWTTSESAVAEVDDDGVVTAGRAGQAEVRASADERTATATVRTEASGIAGASGDPVGEHIRDIPFEQAEEEEFTETQGSSLLVSPSRLTVSLAEGVSVTDVNGLLEDAGASVIGAHPVTSTLYVRVPDRSVSETVQRMEDLTADARVAVAVADFSAFGDARLPPHHRRTGVPLWNWGAPNSNWAQAIRLPQLWNLENAVRRSEAEHRGCVIVSEHDDTWLSGGAYPDTDHEDLEFSRSTPDGDDRHATAVAGVIGARWGNVLGIEGAAPGLDRLEARSFGRPWSSLARDLMISLSLPGSPVAECHSLVLNFSVETEAEPNPVHEALIEHASAFFSDLLEDGHAEGYIPDLTFMVAAAGNSGRTEATEAQWDDPITLNASIADEQTLSHPHSWFTVEASERDGTVWSDSNQPPRSVAAPGTGVTTTTPGDGYGTFTSTSFAAPVVSGLLSALTRVSRSLTDLPASAERRREVLRTVLSDGAYTRTVEGTIAGEVDAFAAAMGIDQELKRKDLQRALVNVNDRTSDGNQRQDPFSGETVEAVPARPTDDTVNMRDFRAFRDAWLQLHGDSEPGGASLDGPADHVKKDLNRDGCVEGELAEPSRFPSVESKIECRSITGDPDWGEDLFPRYDFNGNGRIHEGGAQVDDVPDDALAPFKADPDVECTSLADGDTGCLRDIDVLADVWNDEEIRASDSEKVHTGEVPEVTLAEVNEACRPPPDQWTPTALMGDQGDRDGDGIIDYMKSYDLHVDVADPETDPHLGPLQKAADESPSAVVPAVGVGGLVVLNTMIAKCRGAAWEGTLTVPTVTTSEGEAFGAILTYMASRTSGAATDVRLLTVPDFSAVDGYGADVALSASFDHLALHRSDGTSAFEDPQGMSELIYRSASDPLTSEKAFWTSPCVVAKTDSELTDELKARLRQKAEELWLGDGEVSPSSLLRQKLEEFGHSATIRGIVGFRLGLGETECEPDDEEKVGDRAKLWGALIASSDPTGAPALPSPIEAWTTSVTSR